ncbi:signal peptidase I [Bacillus cereus group sp. BceL062]|uniref:signal peptidase I n=1 Tax=Bacillus cereus group sp. BceL062 TaxID=3445166 RepID=UPI003F28D3B2
MTNREHFFMSRKYTQNTNLIELFIDPQTEFFIVKRVIGKSGDTVEIKGHNVYRNGKQLAEPYTKEMMYPSMEDTCKVPKNHVFVMGDKQNHSKNSRVIGCIPIDHALPKFKKQ